MPIYTGLLTGSPSPSHILYLSFKLISYTRRKPQNKKHKTWDGDAYVTVQGGTLILVSERGKM